MTRRQSLLLGAALAILVVGYGLAPTRAQDRLSGLPGYEQHQKMSALIPGSWVPGSVSVNWSDDSGSLSYTTGGKAYHFDIATMTATETGDAPMPAGRFGRGGARGGRGQGRGAPPPAGRGRSDTIGQTEMSAGPIEGCPQTTVSRGRQNDCVVSPDRTRKAFYRDRNLWIANYDGSGEKAITTDGSDARRIKYGTASWVYGEELSQTSAIWWSPDSRRVAFYRFDESQVKDFFLQVDQTKVQDALDVEAYPKPGQPNPAADVLAYDIATGQTTTMDVRGGQPFDNAVVGYYVYNVHWAPDSGEIYLNRANRRQQVVEFAGCAAASGRCRTIVHEDWPTGWLNTDAAITPSYTPRWLADGRRFIWESERTGWLNYYLYDATGALLHPITANAFESAGIVKIDERAGVLFYLARDGDNYLKVQLHRVGLDGRNDIRLTDPAFTHAVGSCLGGGAPAGRAGGGGCGVSPDDRFFVDVYQTHDRPPASQLVDAATGKPAAQLAKSDLTKYDADGFRKPEQFTYLAADGKTTLYGQISFPSNFDPAKKYPTLVPVYGGPVLVSNVATENFAGPNPICEFGFLVVTVSYRGVPGLGKRAADALYLKLGQTEMDDMAEGIKALWSRPYFDRTRVGIYGTSYGGYTSVMQILRHPDVFAAASASSPPTDWRNYDTIYTERYMWIPQDNADGYDKGSAMTYAKDLRGRLLLYYGTADNNVHPSNAMQLIRALQQAGKSFEVQVGPDMGHSGVNGDRMMEFFIENLIAHPERLMEPAAGGR